MALCYSDTFSMDSSRPMPHCSSAYLAKMFRNFVFLLFAVSLAAASPITLESLIENNLPQKWSPPADASEFVDQLLANVRAQLVAANLGSINLGTPLNESFSVTILGITYHGEIALSDVHVDGLTTLHRTGVAELTPEPNGDFVITADVGLNDCGIGSGILLKFMGLGPKGSLSGFLKNVRVQLKIRLNLLDAAVKLEKFEIVSLGTLSVDIKGLGVILNIIAETVVNVVGNLIKGLVGSLLEGVIKDIVNAVLESLFAPPRLLATHGETAYVPTDYLDIPLRLRHQF